MSKAHDYKRTLLVLLGLGWVAFVALGAAEHWPQVPLDMRAGDPEVRTAYDAAVTRHALKAVALALVVPLVLLGVFRLSGQRSGAVVAPTRGGPKRVLLMRHAEKTGDPDDVHLSDAGRARARRLVQFIPQTYGAPDFLFAAARSKHSLRSIETLEPLAQALGKPLRFDIEDRDVAALVNELFSQPRYRGATVVVAWHHGKLPEIAVLLGVGDGVVPDPWPDDAFNLVIDIRYRADGTVDATRATEPF